MRPPQSGNLMGNGWLNSWPQTAYLTKPSVALPCMTEMYLSQGGFEGGGLSSPTQRRLSNARNNFVLHYPNTSHPMAYFNNDYNNADFYYPALPAPAPEEFDAYQFPRQEPTAEEVNFPAHPTLDDQWNMARRPGSMVGEPTNYGNHQHNPPVDWCLTREPPESVAPATSYATQAGGYGQPSYSGQYWPEVGQQTQSYPSGFLGRDVPFTSMEALEASTTRPAPSSGEYLFS